jgi:hypothetical protein
MSNAAIPVLLMNPEHNPMARKRTTHRRPAAHAKARRRHHNPSNPRRRRATHRRRRRNPSIDFKGLALAGLGGLGVAGAEFALDGVTSITNGYQALILAGLGLVGGGVLSMWSPAIGFGVFATGVGIGAYKGGTMLLAAPSTGSTTTTPAQTQGLGAVQAELSAVRAQLNAVRGQLGAAQGNIFDPSQAAVNLAGVPRF